jgi:hypothetical protein
MRKAVVNSDSKSIAAYLPSRYSVVKVEDGKTFIEGEDFAGWTLEGYVIPRLGSGMFFCEEIK